MSPLILSDGDQDPEHDPNVSLSDLFVYFPSVVMSAPYHSNHLRRPLSLNDVFHLLVENLNLRRHRAHNGCYDAYDFPPLYAFLSGPLNVLLTCVCVLVENLNHRLRRAHDGCYDAYDFLPLNVYLSRPLNVLLTGV